MLHIKPMKMKYLLALVLLLPLSALAQQAPALHEKENLQLDLDRILIDRLLALSRDDFKGKPVQELMSSPEAAGFSEVSFRYTPSGAVDYLMLQYSPKVFLSVYAGDSTSQVLKMENSQATLQKFKEAAISKIGVRVIMLQEGEY